jgi:hypothetical protein
MQSLGEGDLWAETCMTEHAEAIARPVLHHPGVFETILMGLSKCILEVHDLLLSLSFVAYSFR